ncbi:MAG: response regulator [Acidobacteria bacterium]|nr:response regulator [Acidobacteriota bacterium]
MAVNIGKLVLVIDDEPDLRLFIKTVLEDAGFEVDVAGNGKEALERMTEKKPDVISLDLVMPKMSGLKFYKYIQKNKDRSGIPVVVVTAHARDEMGQTDLEKIRAAKPEDGTMFIVDKPIDPPAYVNTVRRALGMSEIEPEGTGEEDVLKVRLKEKMKSADKKKLEDALKILDHGAEGG